MTRIEIRGARTHNLKGIDVDVPNTGSSRSRAERQRQVVARVRHHLHRGATPARRDVQHLCRRRLPQLTRPPVDAIRNISPCIVIDQKSLGASSRSTVGTVTEIYTYLRLLFSRCGRPFIGWSHRFSFNHPEGMCPACKGLGKRIAVDIDKLLDLDRSIEEGAIRHPAYDIGKWYWREIVQSEVVPVRKPLHRFSEAERERLLWADGVRIQKSHEGAAYEGTFYGVARKLEQLHVDKDEDQISRAGKEAYRRLFAERACPDCGGVRLNAEARAVELAGGWTVGRLVECELTELDRVLEELVGLDDYEPIRDVVATLVSRMRRTLRHLIGIGVGYLSLNRGVPTLSGGESQRVKMARQLDCDIVDLIYILDEPTVGLHPAGHRPARRRGRRRAGLQRSSRRSVARRHRDLARAERPGRRAGSQPPDVRRRVPHRERHLQQPAQPLGPDTEGRADVRHRRRRVGQEFARGGVHRVPPAPAGRCRARRRGGRGRSTPRGAFFPVQSRDLRRRVRLHPAGVRRRQPGVARALQLQRQGLLPEVQGPGIPGGRAVVPRRRATGVQDLRRQAVPRRRAADDLPWPFHP